MVDEAGRQVKSAFTEQKDVAVDQLSGLASVLRQSSDQLRQQDQGAFTLGLLAARFLKSSPPDAHQRRTYETQRRNRSYATSHLRENDRSQREEGLANPYPSMRNVK